MWSFLFGPVAGDHSDHERMERVVQTNCIRCHAERVAMINQERKLGMPSFSPAPIWPACG